MIFKSNVPNFEGMCKPVWINKNQFYRRMDRGITGFFKLVKKKWGINWKVGKQFHGIIKDDGEVYTTRIGDDEDGY